jgi:hypothetical protein
MGENQGSKNLTRYTADSPLGKSLQRYWEQHCAKYGVQIPFTDIGQMLLYPKEHDPFAVYVLYLHFAKTPITGELTRGAFRINAYYYNRFCKVADKVVNKREKRLIAEKTK